ncbi:hypothetical protein ACWGJ6_32335, partial [Streptomyces canus]
MVTHAWEDVEARLGRLTLTAAALDALTGDAWDTVDERLRFLVERAAAWAGHEPQMTHSTLCTEGAAPPWGAIPGKPKLSTVYYKKNNLPTTKQSYIKVGAGKIKK